MLSLSFFIPVVTITGGLSSLLFNRFNLIQVLISFEIITLGVILCLGISSVMNSSIYPIVLSMVITVVSASEIAIGLTIVIIYYKINGTIESSSIICG